MITRARKQNQENAKTSNLSQNSEINPEITPVQAMAATITNEQLHESLQNVLAMVTKNNLAITTVNNDIHTIKEDIESIKDVTNESEGVKEQLYATQGKVTRLEMKNANLESKLSTLESKLYHKDLMFYNLPDQANETDLTLINTVYDTIENTMKVPLNQIYASKNPTGEIRLDNVIRMGKFKEGYNRPVIATFLTRLGKNIVNSTTHTSNLKNPIRIRVSEHFPTVVKERRQIQTKHLADLRETYKNTTTKVSLNKDRIIVNGKERNTFSFQRNQLPATSPTSINYQKLLHSQEITEKGSIFQGHSLTVQTKNQAAAARNAIYQDASLCRATHIIYAYRIGVNGENVESGFFDDEEVGAGKELMNLLETKNITNRFLCVTRIKNGSNIGPVRFTHIKTCATAMLEQDDQLEPTFNQLHT